MLPPMQNALAPSPPPSPQRNRPLRQCEAPMPRHQHTTKDIDNLNHKAQETISALLDREQQGLDVVLEEDTGHSKLADDVRLLGDGILVGEDRAVLVAGVDGVDGGHDGEEVLEFMEVVWRAGDGAVERVEEGRVEGAKGELGDYM